MVTGSGSTRRHGRVSLKSAEKLRVWVGAGGVCVLCKRYLLEGPLTGVTLSLGELAHIVGQQVSSASPRGLDPMPREDRDRAENILLACPTCHAEIDDQLVAGILNVERLVSLKARHERRIRHVTTLPDDQRTLVLRLVGKVRGNPVEVTRTTAAATVTAGGRFPWFDLDRDRIGVEVDLSAIPGEESADDTAEEPGGYYAVARAAIDEVIDTLLRDAIKVGGVRHVSVFAFARLPLLVYLGSKLEDNVNVDVYQRHRETQTWDWNVDAPTRSFTLTEAGELSTADEALLIGHVSGSVDLSEVPVRLRDLPQLIIAPDALPSPDVLRSRASLAAFTGVLRQAYAIMDAHKQVRRLHVIGALPPATAVEVGRLHDPHLHPALVLYSRRDDHTYRSAMEIT